MKIEVKKVQTNPISKGLYEKIKNGIEKFKQILPIWSLKNVFLINDLIFLP